MRPYREITQLLVYLFCLFILAYAALIVPSSPKKGRSILSVRSSRQVLIYILFVYSLFTFIYLSH